MNYLSEERLRVQVFPRKAAMGNLPYIRRFLTHTHTHRAHFLQGTQYTLKQGQFGVGIIAKGKAIHIYGVLTILQP